MPNDYPLNMKIEYTLVVISTIRATHGSIPPPVRAMQQHTAGY